jgi:UDP-N-acetylmuramoyl-tripeptide--D-alanyl-D-alanine ligase
MTLPLGILGPCFLGAGFVLFRRYVHIFQLNSYKHKVQERWVRDNIEQVLLRSVWALGAAPLVQSLGGPGAYAAAVLFLLVLGLNLPRQKAKKPLVMTKRVWRLLVTAALLHILCLIFLLFMPDGGGFGALLCSFCLAGAPWLILLADTINAPVEKAINRWYIRDAEKLLRSCPDLKIIGVTGSYGKTSVKFFLEKLLSTEYNTLVTPENYNTTLGVVRTVRERLRATHEVFVCEMGARNVGDIKEICDLVHPGYGIITAIGPQHLESFGSLANVIRTKFELADALPEDGILFANMDDENIRGRKTAVRTVGYGLRRGDYLAEDLTVSPQGSSFRVRGVEFRTRLLGAHNVQNICAAIAAANTLGIPLEKLREPVRQLESVPHRLQLLGGGGRTVIDDAYNSNPAGASAALEVLAAFPGLRILVTPGMVELGEKQRELNRAFGAQAAEKCEYALLVGKRQAPPIREGLLSAGFPEDRIRVCDTVQEAVALADSLEPGRERVILLENDLPDNY